MRSSDPALGKVMDDAPLEFAALRSQAKEGVANAKVSAATSMACLR
eukprot:CAMPEP_0115306076 /NCGR_PEP_ID=MMETSP0270-20121206/72381_1 /TAXON_ID=71861 /ORGANISM="Scrippsiella trochoidea, Strain CCMP3099" /LENGTH=45 /DNA_ID= /DNA_START= /DNA_END= /DNA_ORIENTATION=